MGDLMRDLQLAARTFARTPRFTIPALLALALGIGATAATFSVVRGVMLKPLPYADPDRVVVVWERNVKRNRERNVIGPANFVEWRERNRSFEKLGMVGPSRMAFMLGGQPEEVTGLNVSSDVFSILGVQPAIGRAYTAEEDVEGRDAVIVLSHEFWQTRLGGDPDALGMTVQTDGRLRTVVGIMPPGFTVIGQKAAYLKPYGWTMEALRGAGGRGSSHGLARLRDGVSFEQAQADMTAIAAQLEQEVPRRNAGWSVALVPVHEQMVDQIRPALLVLAGAVALVLLVSTVNVANLLLARSVARQRELGLRTALGAGRGRLLRQMLSESLLLGLAGGLAGLALAFAFHRGLLALVADRIPVPRLEQVSLDMPVLLFTLGLAVATSVLFGLLPAAVASRGVAGALQEGGRHNLAPRSRRFLGALVVAEVALTLVLLTGAGLLIQSFVRLQLIDPGFRADGLLTGRVQTPSSRYSDDRVSASFYTTLVDRISNIPGVASAAAVTFPPLGGFGIGTSFWRADQPKPADGEAPSTDVKPVTPDFFRTMGIPLLAGRDITPADAIDSPPIAVISETLARRHYPGENPLGRPLHVNIGQAGGTVYEIVGVVGDIKMTSLEGETRPAVYVPHTQLAFGVMTLMVRTQGPPLSYVDEVTGALRSLDPEIPLADVRTMDEAVDATLARPRVIAVLLAVFALMALTLAGVGVYGVISYSVSQRTQEIGVRMALGATVQSIFRLVLKQALRLVAIGLVVGVLLAGGLTRLLDALLYQTEPLDPWTFIGTAALVVLVGLLASYVPARRGTRIAPVEALRAE